MIDLVPICKEELPFLRTDVPVPWENLRDNQRKAIGNSLVPFIQEHAKNLSLNQISIEDFRRHLLNDPNLKDIRFARIELAANYAQDLIIWVWDYGFSLRTLKIIPDWLR